MCGIVAILSQERPVAPDVLHRAITTLTHRGPDGHDQWIAPSQKIGLAHTRLQIIDLVTGAQPIANEDGQVHIVVSGELYDHDTIRHRLEERGHRFRTHSDSEIALHLYEEYGADCVHHLRGEFAFVLWDERTQTLFAARDRFGIKPLYYANIGGTLYLASEAKALLAAGVPARWDHESFFQFHTMLNYQQERSLFADIRQIPPGYFLRATPYDQTLHQYWDFDFPLRANNTVPTQRSDADYAEEFLQLLDDAVRVRLRADVPVGCYLSGGIDSASILTLAAQHADTPIHAFTIGFEHSPFDEIPAARRIADQVGAIFHPTFVTQADLAAHFSAAVWHSETLCINPHGAAKFLLSRAVQQSGHKVVLTGEGSDEMLAGYLHFMRDMLLYNPDGQDLRVFEPLLGTNPPTSANSTSPAIAHRDIFNAAHIRQRLGFVPTWMEASETLAFTLRSLLSPDFARAYHHYDGYRMFLESFSGRAPLRGRDPVNQSMYLWNKLALPNYELNVLGDRTEMAHGVEGRTPFLDHTLVEMINALPIRQKINGLAEKFILRNAARSLVPHTITQRPKNPFLAPPATLFPHEAFSELLHDTLRGPDLLALPFYHQKSVIALLDQLPHMDDHARSTAGNILTAILSACVLQQKFRFG